MEKDPIPQATSPLATWLSYLEHLHSKTIDLGLARVSEVAGQTEVRVAREPGSRGQTEETAVRAEHRGRGLALWIKDHNIRWLHTQRPDVPHVKTDNDVTNTAMLAVNTRLGFVATSESVEAILDL